MLKKTMKNQNMKVCKKCFVSNLNYVYTSDKREILELHKICYSFILQFDVGVLVEILETTKSVDTWGMLHVLCSIFSSIKI